VIGREGIGIVSSERLRESDGAVAEYFRLSEEPVMLRRTGGRRVRRWGARARDMGRGGVEDIGIEVSKEIHKGKGGQ